MIKHQNNISMQDQIDENKSPSSSSTNESTPRSGALRKQIQHQKAEEEDPIECTGKTCQSCTGSVIADCVAVSCCPCAVVDILAFTFLKIPYLMGRKWLTKGRMRMRRLEKKKKKRKEKTSGEGDQKNERVVARKESVEHEEGALESEAMELGNEEIEDNFSGDEEDFWLELYRIGQLGFGRVSFSTTGSSSQRKITTN